MRYIAKFFTHHPRLLLLVLLAITIWPFFFVRSEFNAPFLIAFKYLSAPIIASCLLIGWLIRKKLMAACKGHPWLWIGFIGFPFLMILWSAGPVLQANVLLPPQKEIQLEGIVVHKTTTRGLRTSGYIVDVRTQTGIKRIEVSRQAYSAIQEGSHFRQQRWFGPLGFSYVWRYQRPPPSPS